MDTHLFNKKGVKRELALVFDDGDNILECIKQAMQGHGITEVNVEEAEGAIKEGAINYFERSSYRDAKLNNNRLMRVSGNFKLSYGDLFGKMNIFTYDKPPLQGTFVKGKAAQGLVLKLSFIEFIDPK